MDQTFIKSAVKDFVDKAMTDPRLDLIKRAPREGEPQLKLVGGTDLAERPLDGAEPMAAQ